MRVDRHSFFMLQAHIYSLRGTCLRRKVGCVLVHNNRIKSAGYNSSPQGTPHCEEVGCLKLDGEHCERCEHAEIAAIQNLERQYETLTAYCTLQPCYRCLRQLATANVSYIYYRQPYNTHSYRDELAEGLKITMIQQDIPHEFKHFFPDETPYSS